MPDDSDARDRPTDATSPSNGVVDRPTDGDASDSDTSAQSNDPDRNPSDVGAHTFPLERADSLDDPSRYRFCSREELLEALDPDPDAAVADLGSGTGFYARDVAPFVGRLYAVDVQAAMHERFRGREVPDGVAFVTADVSALPFADDRLDAAYSTMTHHEYADPASFAELARVLRPGGTLVTVDWSADGEGDDGPPVADRVGPDEARAQLADVGFTVESVRTRPETFVVVARR